MTTDEIIVSTASRLHFGLLIPPSDMPVSRARQIGSLGMMVRAPGLRLRVRSASQWSAQGPLADRALAFAKRYQCAIGEPDRCFHLNVEHAPRDHVGLGTGTQLGLAVAAALQQAQQLPAADVTKLAQYVGRGQRSAIGIYGFAQGGFLVDGGKTAAMEIAPLVHRCTFPEDWSILLVIPRDAQGTHGQAEQKAFAEMKPTARKEADALCRLVHTAMLPALHSKDVPTFGEVLYEFNRRAGEQFRPFQHGIYATSRTADIISFLRNAQITGVGQSSWGPTVFAVMETEKIGAIRDRLCARFALYDDEAVMTAAANEGARCKSSRASIT